MSNTSLLKVSDEEHETQEEYIDYICFNLEDQEFGIPITQVQEIIVPPPITSVIHTPDIIHGVINIRGIIVAVINLKNLFGFSDSNNSDIFKIIIINITNKSDSSVKKAGLLVDSINVVKHLKKTAIEYWDFGNDGASGFCDGVIQLENKPLTILSINKILDAPDLKQFN